MKNKKLVLVTPIIKNLITNFSLEKMEKIEKRIKKEVNSTIEYIKFAQEVLEIPEDIAEQIDFRLTIDEDESTLRIGWLTFNSLHTMKNEVDIFKFIMRTMHISSNEIKIQEQLPNGFYHDENGDLFFS